MTAFDRWLTSDTQAAVCPDCGGPAVRETGVVFCIRDCEPAEIVDWRPEE